jgi:hypothetical protein
MLVLDSCTSSTNGAFGRHERAHQTMKEAEVKLVTDAVLIWRSKQRSR